jgi:hypothetical protein
VPPVVFNAVCALVAREDRTAERRVFQGFGGDRFRTAIARACTAAGVPAFSPHGLRHRRISLLHSQGVPWARIGEHVGQRSLVPRPTRTRTSLWTKRTRLFRDAAVMRFLPTRAHTCSHGAYPRAYLGAEKTRIAGRFDSCQAQSGRHFRRPRTARPALPLPPPFPEKAASSGAFFRRASGIAGPGARVLTAPLAQLRSDVDSLPVGTVC